MVTSLQSLFDEIATASTEQALRSHFMDHISHHFDVQRWGIYLLDNQNCLASVDVKGVSDQFIERYQKWGKAVDPVLKYVVQYHTPAHEALVLPRGTWKQSELYQRCCAEGDHEHIMTGPMVGRGQLVGTVHLARVGDTLEFNQLDLARLGAICTHLSTRLAELRQIALKEPNPNLARLTPREIQIANLVAQGLTNADIGKELWITQNSVKQALKRMFRKLNVSARTEMVAKLRDSL
ncbi:MAG: LuxR C-terminal-related transcriptional regulator [Cyanobacteria bacterium P01_D01_bin.44]